MDQPVGAGLKANISAVRISGRPIPGPINFAWLNRIVADRGAGQQALGESNRVNKGLESRTDLAIGRRQRAIEFALRIIAPADQSANPPTGVVDCHDGAFQIRHGRVLTVFRRPVIRFQRMIEIRLAFDLAQLRLERLLRGLLHSRIERRVNEHTAVVDLVLGEEQIQIALHRVHCVIFLDLQHPFRVLVHFDQLGLVGFRD